ncbi:Retrovirus-related Pol polyprotein from transposon 17.6 [Mytilus coruscus]|uniref:Retrovirus-related Pol polyprotein from transposon 17.6 n=1 Tax=Mytilus coruscus TaxID=42192 RepID=A0A6J8ANU5_MYTCO|nr:Retrovirus-related Pol polyprotein from transposon 17.6 [Mytilus coruscus]
MPFGLANSPKTFERLMEIVLSGLQWERCLVYLDDIIVFGKTFSETLNNLSAVFERFRKANLKLKAKNCFFFQDEIKYLGHVVSERGIKCDPEKTTPFENGQNRKVKFIPSFSELSFPLNQLTRKNWKFKWTDDCENSFHKLKQALTSAPILAYPTQNDSFILDTDASLYGIGAVLSQVQNGEELVISYGSKTLSRAQTKYCTTYRELLAVVTFVKQFRHFLYGRQFLIRIDHSSLIWLKNFKEPEGMVARWISLLDTYDFKIKHRRGAAHGNADALSRQIHVTRHCKRPDCPQCIENTEMTVGAITQKEISSDENNELNNELMRPIESNWLEQ